MNRADHFFRELKRQSRVPHKDYGDAVLDAAKVFLQLVDCSDVAALKEAMNRIVASADERLSSWGKSVFAGFGRYTDIMARPSFIVEGGASRVDVAATRDAPSISDDLQACARANNVPAAIELYSNVRTEEAKAFFDVLETILSSPNAVEREFGVDFSVTLVTARIDPPWARRG